MFYKTGPNKAKAKAKAKAYTRTRNAMAKKINEKRQKTNAK